MSFKFKQFEVVHDQSPMKVGTDAVLLGSMVDLKHDVNALEVGTGCGIVALMLAQRFPEVQFTAIDIDRYASREAASNFQNSPWSDRLSVQKISFQDFAKENGNYYDHIISNPPFFEGDKLSIYPSRTKSRHSVYLSHQDFLESSTHLCHDKTKISLILPLDIAENFIQGAAYHSFHLLKSIKIFPKRSKAANRMIFTLSRQKGMLQRSELIIYDDFGHYSNAFQKLTDPFYL
jgi:tRNA1Val (adenine37-N6)-methyltransferase